MNLRSALIIFASSLCILLLYLNRPARLIFDEQFYIPAAREFMASSRDPNYQHPPLAKEIIGVSTALFGDDPWGWRLASCILGALALVALFSILRLFLNPFYSGVALVLVFTNGLFFSLSRLGLLEIFSLSFTLMGLAVLLKQLYGPEQKKLWTLWLPGMLFGFAVCTKWSALVPLAVCGVGGLLMRKFSLKQWGVFAASCLVFYLLPFLLLDMQGYSLWDLHKGMWAFHYPEVYQEGIMANTSPWWEWAFRIQPMWFAVLPNDFGEPGQFLSVMIFGNPFVIWAGWLGLAWCLKSRESFPRWIVALALAPFLVWAVAQRPVTYYYYFLTTSVFLALALVFAVARMTEQGIFAQKKAQRFLLIWAALSVIFFFYHWPLMTGLEMSAANFQKWYPHIRGYQ